MDVQIRRSSFTRLAVTFGVPQARRVRSDGEPATASAGSAFGELARRTVDKLQGMLEWELRELARRILGSDRRSIVRRDRRCG